MNKTFFPSKGRQQSLGHPFRAISSNNQVRNGLTLTWLVHYRRLSTRKCSPFRNNRGNKILHRESPHEVIQNRCHGRGGCWNIFSKFNTGPRWPTTADAHGCVPVWNKKKKKNDHVRAASSDMCACVCLPAPRFYSYTWPSVNHNLLRTSKNGFNPHVDPAPLLYDPFIYLYQSNFKIVYKKIITLLYQLFAFL